MRINLLPPEIRERQRIRRRAVLMGIVVSIVVVGLIGFGFLQQQRRARIEEDLAGQETINGQLRQEIASLQEFELLRQELAATRAEVDALLVNEVLWSGVLRDISLVLPSEAWLTVLNGSVFTPENQPVVEEGVDLGLVGQMTFNGFGLDHRVVALWLSRLEEVEGFVNPWLDSSEQAQIGTTQVSQFVNSVDLSEAAAVPRGGGPA